MESLDIVTPSRGRMAVFVGEVVEGREDLLKRTFLTPIRVLISKRETNFLANSGGNAW